MAYSEQSWFARGIGSLDRLFTPENQLSNNLAISILVDSIKTGI